MKLKTRVMRRIVIAVGILIGIAAMLVTFKSNGQTKNKPMKLNAGVVTSKLQESKTFYMKAFNFGVTFENEFYLLMHTPDQSAQFAFLLPDHSSQQPLFRPAFEGRGMFLTIEVADVDAEYKRIKGLNIPVAIELRDEPWGDRHFAIVDPNGIGVDVVTYKAP
jgi:uncharacterized glyoxalase superfamily protein PhnB